MSVSIANRKYRKYENLIKADPKNEKYKHKMEKYTKMIQTGGTSIPHQMQQYVQQPVQQSVQPVQQYAQQPVQQYAQQPPMPTMAGNNDYGLDRLRGNPETADLLKKIQNIVDHSNNSKMIGGSKKHHHSKSKVKGYRNMIGGDGPFGDMMGEGSELESLRMEKQQLEEAYRQLKSLNLSSSQRGGNNGNIDLSGLDARVQQKLNTIDGQIAGLTTNVNTLTTGVADNKTKLEEMIKEYETSMKALRLLPDGQGTFALGK
jgi:hypothetical protein